MDEVLRRARELASDCHPAQVPVRRRIAYMVAHAVTYASNGYAVRTHNIADALTQHGFETLCFLQPGRPWELDPRKFGGAQGSAHSSTPTAEIDHGLGLPYDPSHGELEGRGSGVAPVTEVDGVTYIHSRWSGPRPGDDLEHLHASVQKFTALFRTYRPEIVLAASNWKVALPASVAAWRLGIPFFHEVRGFWELSEIARYPEMKGSLGYQAAVARDTFVANLARRVFTLNDHMRCELVRRGVLRSKIDIVPNAVRKLPVPDPNPLTTVDGLRRKYGISEQDKVLGYVGSISAYEGLDTLLQACRTLARRGESFKLIIVGDGMSLSDIQSDDGFLGLDDGDWLVQVGRVPHKQIDAFYALIDIIVIPREPAEVSELVPPMKIAEALAQGKRLVVSDVVALTDYAEKYPGIDQFEAGSVSSLIDVLFNALQTSASTDRQLLLMRDSVKPMVEAFARPGSYAVTCAPQMAQVKEGEGGAREKGEEGGSEESGSHGSLTDGSSPGEASEVSEVTDATNVTEVTDVRFADMGIARQWFFRKGMISDTLCALENMRAWGATFDQPRREFEAFVRGLFRLKEGWRVPPRQPNAGYMTRRGQVLYCLHQSVPHSSNGYATRSHGIAVGLQAAGFLVRAVTRPGFPWDAAVTGLTKGYHEAVVDGVTYVASSGWPLNKTPLDHYLAQAADLYLREAQTCGAEIIIAASNHITALPALTAARRLGLPFVYEVRGLWEETQASTDPDWAGSERYRLARQLENQVVLEADRVLTLTQELLEELVSWGVPRERIDIIPNAVDAERFTPILPDEEIALNFDLRANHLSGRSEESPVLGHIPVIGYAGSVVAYEGLELLLEALAELKRRGTEFIFLLIGDGKVMEAVKARAEALDLVERCRFAGRVPFEKVPQYLSCVDIMPVPRLSSSVTQIVSPLKPLEAMAMGKAVILSDVSPHKTMAGPNQERALLFESGSVESLADALQKLISDPEARARLGRNGREWIERERTWRHVSALFADAIEPVRASVSVSGPAAGDQVSEQTTTTSFSSPSPSPSPSFSSSSSVRTLGDFRIGLIADRFTTDTLSSAVRVVLLSPDHWREQLADDPVDVVFVESAWHGNDDLWFQRVGHYSDEEFSALKALLAYCRDQGIVTLFWNKEDPVHFDRFREAARLCDHVFTTDSRRIIPYLALPDSYNKTVSSCPFYASPKIHNLLPSSRSWQDTAAYGGTYYGKRYPERTEYMQKIMSAAAPLGLTIYDRQHGDAESPYQYPAGLGGYVAGDLDYAEMIQAYKAHPVQINVNSVQDSPTMFSRRVIEAAACGAPLISGPALCMNRYLGGAAHMIETESDAAQALESLLRYPAYRWRVALKGARAVMRAHTTEHRLVQMLRTAGFVVRAPQVPEVNVLCGQITTAAVRSLLGQTVRPKRVVADVWSDEAKALLVEQGIECLSSGETVATEGARWLLAESERLEPMESEDIEDLVWVSTYASGRIGYLRESVLQPGQWPGVAVEAQNVDGFEVVCPDRVMPVRELVGWAERLPALALRKPDAAFEQPPIASPRKTVVIAGHDLKFIKPFYPYFTQAGIRVLLDFWSGHNQHDEAASKRLLAQADTVFCEWMLGNAIWYGTHKLEGQRLIGRLHLQELDHQFFRDLPFAAFEEVIFVGPHILRQGVSRNSALKRNGTVVYNGVDVQALQREPRRATNGKVLGFVGIVPQRKRFDLALDILRDLRARDEGYTLRVKGKRPEDIPWMADRPQEMVWYDKLYRRLQDDPLLKDAVIFDPHGNDMPEWYAGVDFVLSTSDFESFHFTVADGAAAGCVPVVFPWEGAREIYPSDWVVANRREAVKMIMRHCEGNDRAALQRACRDFAKDKFDIEQIALRLVEAM